MFCVKKFNEHFNIFGVILFPIYPGAGWGTEAANQHNLVRQREAQASLDPRLNILKCKICHSLDSEGNKSKCQKSNLKSDSFLPMFDITRIHTMNTLQCRLIKVRYVFTLMEYSLKKKRYLVSRNSNSSWVLSKEESKLNIPMGLTICVKTNVFKANKNKEICV